MAGHPGRGSWTSRAAVTQGVDSGGKWSKVGIRGRPLAHYLPAVSMFYGEYEHSVDEKNRLTLPARFRNSLADGIVLARGIERCIDVYASASWLENTARIAELDSLNREAREMKRYVFAGAAVAELDRQGRVIIPPHLTEHAGVVKDVVVIGVHDHVEIWDRAAWAVHLSAIEGSAGDVAERLANQRG